MVKRLLSGLLALALVSQGIARADGTGTSTRILTVRDQAALLAHIEAMTPGDRIMIATAEGTIAGEFVDRDANDVVIDRPLVEGGAERLTIPLREIQGVQYQAAPGPSRVETVEKAVIVVALITAAIWLGRIFLAPRP